MCLTLATRFSCREHLLEVDVWLTIGVLHKHSNETGTQPDGTSMNVLHTNTSFIQTFNNHSVLVVTNAWYTSCPYSGSCCASLMYISSAAAGDIPL